MEAEIIATKVTAHGIITKRADGILVFVPHNHINCCTLEGLKEDRIAYLEIQQGAISPLLSDVRNLEFMGSEEKRFVTETAHQFTNAMAVWTDSPLSTFITNMFIKLYRPTLPTKLFTHRDDALEWLKGYL